MFDETTDISDKQTIDTYIRFHETDRSGVDWCRTYFWSICDEWEG